MNNKCKDLERVSLGIALMFGVYWLYSYVLQERLAWVAGIKTVLGLVVLYGVGLGAFLFCIKDIPTQKRKPEKVSGKILVFCFLLQFSAIMLMSVLVNIIHIFGRNEESVAINALSPYMLFLLLVFNPMAEELVFRKLFADKLLKYGERFYVLTTAFCFAIVHGVALGIPQVVYTFILGLVWGYVMAKTHDIKLVIILHALSNFFGGVILQMLMSISMEAAGIYSMLLMGLGAVGLSLFMAKRKKVVLDGESGLMKKETWKEIFTNKGIWIYTALTVGVMIVKSICLT